MQVDLTELRREYMERGITCADLLEDPVAQLNAWLDAAFAAGISNPNAMILATASPDGEPSARPVIARKADERGIAFFTDYRSVKGRQLAANPRAEGVFLWAAVERQARVRGSVDRVPPEESDAYWDTRPRATQVSARSSEQSRQIADRAALEARAAEVEASHVDGPVPRPDYWGGFRITPAAFEFWQGRPNRLHDRILYLRQPDGSWQRSRLMP